MLFPAVLTKIEKISTTPISYFLHRFNSWLKNGCSETVDDK